MARRNLPSYFWRLCWVLALFFILSSSPLKAQPVLNPSNIALGSGGTAYLTGIESTFWNPANLAIRDNKGDFHILVGQTGLLYEPVLSAKAANNQYFGFRDVYYPYNSDRVSINQDQRNSILGDNFPNDNLISQHQNRADIILGGALWQREDEAFSIVARARYGSRIEVGRGWYSNRYISHKDRQIRDLTLIHQRNQFIELSFGYGRSFTFINGLLPQLNKLYVGIAPKIVMAGPHLDMRYNGEYIRNPDTNTEIYASNFSYLSTGNYSQATNLYRNGIAAAQAVNRFFDKKIAFNASGYGMGVDFGLTYVIPLGDDLSTIHTAVPEAISDKVIRIALSINDIGMVRYNEKPLQMTSKRDTTSAGIYTDLASEMYIGSNGQYLPFFDGLSNFNNPINTSDSSDKNYYSLLPTSINAGLLIKYLRLKLMGDLTLGLHNTAFSNTKLALHLGIEGRPLKQVPIRFGVRLASGLPTQLGIGTGFEGRYLDFNIGTQLMIRSQTFTSEIVGGAFSGIKLHF